MKITVIKLFILFLIITVNVCNGELKENYENDQNRTIQELMLEYNNFKYNNINKTIPSTIINNDDIDNQPINIFDAIEGFIDKPKKSSSSSSSSSKPSIENRIMGGFAVTNITDYCYQVGIKVIVGNNSGWCGGAIISHNTVLTAAHCVKSDYFNITGGILYFGTLNRDKPDNGSIIVNFTTEDVIAHEMWVDKLKQHDIAVIKLNQSLPFSAQICYIDLINRRNAHLTFENESMLISGWGRSSDKDDNYEHELKYAIVKGMNLEECTKKLWQAKSSNICVLTNNTAGACRGDSGGPLVYSTKRDGTFDRNTRQLVGITSFTSKGCMHDFPRVYTKVSDYLTWICSVSRVCPIVYPEETYN